MQSHSSNPDPGVPVWIEDIGFSIVYEPNPASSTVADFVLVHGLQGHPRNSWKYSGTVPRENPTSTKESSTIIGVPRRIFELWKPPSKKPSLFWPADLLPRDQRDCRIMTYGYNTRVASIRSGPANQMNISEHGRDLLGALAAERADYPQRPIIFIAHSLGGLLVKEALRRSRAETFHKCLADIYKSTCAIFFFGTPHRGSHDASWGEILRRIASSAQISTAKQILADLNPSSGSSKLDELDDAFRDMVSDRDLLIFTFQEARGKASIKSLQSLVVPKESSALNDPREMRFSVDSNHMNMCKFKSSSDDGYKKLLFGISLAMKSVQKGGSEALHQVHEAVDGHRREILESLKFENMFHKKEHTQTIADDLSRWIWSTEEQGPGMAEWLSNGMGIFLVYGKPGSGKSTLLKHLASHRKTRDLLGQEYEWSQKSCRPAFEFYFDYGAGNELTNSLQGMIRAISYQIVEQLHAIPASLEKAIQKMSNSRTIEIERYNSMEGQNILKEIIRAVPGKICAFIDGLDEYGGSMIELASFLQGLSSMPNIKLCLASRPQPILLAAFQGNPSFKMQDFNSDSIDAFVSTRMKVFMNPLQPKNVALLRDFTEQIVRRAEGVILWARFATDELLKGFARCDSSLDLHHILEQFPQELKAIYEQILGRIEVQDQAPVKSVLQLVASAAAPISVRVLHLVQDHLGDEDCQVSVCSMTDEDIVCRLNSRTQGLLVFTESRETTYAPSSRRNSQLSDQASISSDRIKVTLIHKTLLNFLESSTTFESFEPVGSSVYMPQSWLGICTKVIELAPPPIELDRSWISKSSLARSSTMRLWEREGTMNPVLSYAIRFVFKYSRLCEAESPGTSYQKLSKAIESQWLSCHDLFEGHCACQLHEHDDLPPWRMQSLRIAAAHGLARFCHDYLSDKKNMIEDSYPQGDIQNALFAAISSCISNQRLETLILVFGLLSRVDHVEGFILHLAIAECLEIVVAILLKVCRTEKGLKLNVVNITPDSLGYHTDLSYFTIFNCEKDTGARGLLWSWVHADNNDSQASERTLDLLIEFGEEVNAICCHEGTVLHALINIGQVHLLHALWKRGIDVNVIGPHGSPLHFAWQCKAILERNYTNLEDIPLVRDLAEIMAFILSLKPTCLEDKRFGNLNREHITSWIEKIRELLPGTEEFWACGDKEAEEFWRKNVLSVEARSPSSSKISSISTVEP